MQQWLVAGHHLYQTATSLNVQECPQQELSSLWVMPLSKTCAGVATVDHAILMIEDEPLLHVIALIENEPLLHAIALIENEPLLDRE